jgi:inorganic pyrophosphatase-like protein
MDLDQWWHDRLEHLPFASSIRLLEVVVKARPKLHYRTKRFGNLPISIENRRGSWRKWRDGNGVRGQTKVKDSYGYVRHSMGLDDEFVDVFLGPDSSSKDVYLVYQLKHGSNEIDEIKAILGAHSISEARNIYLRNYDHKGPSLLGWIEKLSLTEFKDKLEESRDNPDIFL